MADEIKKRYLPTIGIECHIQLKSRTKLFSAVSNDAREAAPNTLISHIDAGLPGALPVLNGQALKLAARAAYALRTTPQKFSHFDRKHYFYPDLPKGYQITQYSHPIIRGGQVQIEVDGETKKIGITRAHLEEDAGKNTHPAGTDYSLVDLNRAGTPLLEIVSEPQLHSAAEAKAFAHELYLLMKYADVSDVDLYHGNMRFDVNISVSAEEGQLGKRTEVKNLNSFRSLEAAINYEIKRQTALYQAGEEVAQETRGWDEAKQQTISQRGKEEAHDYRYFPDPDLPPVELSDEDLKEIAASVPELPPVIRARLAEAGFDKKIIEDILERSDTVELILLVLAGGGPEHARRVAFWLLQNEADAPIKIAADKLIKLSKMVDDDQLSSTAAKQVLQVIRATNEDPTAAAQNLNLLQLSDDNELSGIVKKIIDENPRAVEDIRNGENKAVGFLVGQAMKASQGKANPGLLQQIIKKQLGV